MRIRVFAASLTLLAAGAAQAAAQPAPPAPSLRGHVDFGLRTTGITGDAARLQRYRDLGDGPFLDRLRYVRTRADWRVEVDADHAGRLDQRYAVRYRSGNGLRVSFRWDQVPLFYSRDVRTLYAADGDGTLGLADVIQQGLQTGQLAIANVIGQAGLFDLRSRRDSAVLAVTYQATRDLDLTVAVTSANRTGTMPWGVTFGHSNSQEVAAPVETRTTDVRAGVEWTRDGATVRVSYDGSWFDNRVPALVWDNPYVLTSGATTPSQGRMALPPDSRLHAVTTAGTLSLPARTRATATVTLGSWRQNATLLPFTINPAAVTLPLDRDTADAGARTLAVNATLTSRPVRQLWLNARVRFYDFDNRTPPFHVTQYNRLDAGLVTRASGGSEPLSSTRHHVDLDASFTPARLVAFRVGYGRESVDRTFRIFNRTTEHTVRASVDATPAGWLTVRGIVERAVREGAGFKEEALTGVGEQPLMRHFDVADRWRNRATALVQVTPRPELGVSLAVTSGHDDYRTSGFGLRDSRSRSYALNLDLAPRDEVAAGLAYTFERYDTLQRSRSANPGAQFVDPARDWALDSGDRVHTGGAWLDLLRLIPRTEARLGYDYTRSQAGYVFVLPAGGVLPAPVPLPPVIHELRTATVDTRYYLSPRVALGVVYAYDRYRVEDFAMSPGTIPRLDMPGSAIFLGYLYRPYRAHSGWLRVTYFW